MAELLPCPFCGGEPVEIEARDYKHGFVHHHAIHCFACGIEVSDEYRSNATEAWNNRAEPSPDAINALVEALRPFAEQCKLNTSPFDGDTNNIEGHTNLQRILTVSDFRRAAAAYDAALALVEQEGRS